MALPKQDCEVVAPDRWNQDVMDFCEEHQLAEKLDLVVELIEQAFPEAQRLSVTVDEDRESPLRSVLVDVIVSGSAHEVRIRHQECVHRLLKLLPWPVCTLLRTTYTLR